MSQGEIALIKREIAKLKKIANSGALQAKEIRIIEERISGYERELKTITESKEA